MDYLYQLINFIKHWSSYFGLRDNRQNFEDAFYRLLHEKNYNEALKLAQQYKYLDIDLVYKCKWRHSGITVQSINSVLASINDKLWAINECVQTVPISNEACRTLLEFGLEQANLKLLYHLGNETYSLTGSGSKHEGKIRGTKKDKQPLLRDDASDEEIEGLIDFNCLNDQQNELCKCRQDLLRHKHSLVAYENIVGDYRDFDHVFYNEFRQKCPLNACIDYSHEGDAHAVEILLKFYTDSLRPHLLAILSNFPETLPPNQYRNLLQWLREEDILYEGLSLSGQIKREEFDWSSRGKTNSSFTLILARMGETYEKDFYEENANMKKYLKPLTSEVLTGWFIERALEMESRTLLLHCAIELLRLGSELKIKGLEETHGDLDEFQEIIYDCCTEDNIYLNFAEFNQMLEIDRLILMTGNSPKNCKDRFRFCVIPYISRRVNKPGFKSKLEDILRGYFRRLAHSRESICNLIYNDLLDRIECGDFVAEWTKDMDDVLDEIGEEIKTIERERQAKELSTLASQTMALGEFSACYDTCELIMKKGHKECWALCCQLGMHKEFHNIEAKYRLLAFALAHCDDPTGKLSAKLLDHIIELRKRDERIQTEYLRQNM